MKTYKSPRSFLIFLLLLALSLPILLVIYQQLRPGKALPLPTRPATNHLLLIYEQLQGTIPKANKTETSDVSLLLIKLLGLVGGTGLAYYLLRSFLLRPTRYKTTAEKESGLIVNTFQDIIYDLKDKKEEVQAYAETLEEYNQNILRGVVSGVVTFDCDGKVKTINPAAEAILGVQGNVVLGRTCEDLFGSNKAFSQFVQETLCQEKEIIREESEGIKSDGGKIWLGLTTSALRNKKGTLVGAIIVFTDLTAMKVLQEQVDLKKRLALLGEMSAFIAHEFRNYMGAIWGYASILSKDLKSNAGAQEMTAGIIKELTTMDQLITDLLSYGKNPVLTLRQTALIPLIEEALHHVRIQHLVTELQECEAEVDAGLMRQALTNLIQNGLEAMASDEDVQQEEGRLTIKLGNKGDHFVEIKISDTGRGIPADQLDKIFLPFFTTKAKGNGLGLALVHKIMLAHNGTISVVSQEHKGTTFTITLPAFKIRDRILDGTQT
jgi:PAS domain S-box-containing protein